MTRDGQGHPRGGGRRPRCGSGAHGAGHDPVPRRDPPVHQVPAGRAAAVGRDRAARPHRRHHREPVLRGQPAADVSRSTLFRLQPARTRRPAPSSPVGASRPRARPPTTRPSTHLVDRSRRRRPPPADQPRGRRGPRPPAGSGPARRDPRRPSTTPRAPSARRRSATAATTTTT